MYIISWNVNGLRAIIKKGLFKSIKDLDPDILCLQETKAQCDEVEEALANLSDYELFCNSAEKRGYAGTAILTKKKPISVTKGMQVAEHDQEGRLICAEYENFYLVNLYVPNSGEALSRLEYRKKWDADLLNYLKKLEKQKPVIAGGDFNVAHRAIDLKNDKANYNKTAGYTQTEIDGMDNLIEAGFVDFYRLLHPKKVAYTYWSYRFNARARNAGWRIDYFIGSKSLIDKVKTMTILSDYYGSDHCPVGLELRG